MNAVKQWRELRRELRRTKDPQNTARIRQAICNVEATMKPKQLKQLKQVNDL